MFQIILQYLYLKLNYFSNADFLPTEIVHRLPTIRYQAHIIPELTRRNGRLLPRMCFTGKISGAKGGSQQRVV
jgi:hypothetical protein